jgi:hypothetical protein
LEDLWILYSIKLCDMFFRDNKNMHGPHWVSIGKGQNVIVFIEKLRGQLLISDFTKHAIHN